MAAFNGTSQGYSSDNNVFRRFKYIRYVSFKLSRKKSVLLPTDLTTSSFKQTYGYEQTNKRCFPLILWMDKIVKKSCLWCSPPSDLTTGLPSLKGVDTSKHPSSLHSSSLCPLVVSSCLSLSCVLAVITTQSLLSASISDLTSFWRRVSQAGSRYS